MKQAVVTAFGICLSSTVFSAAIPDGEGPILASETPYHDVIVTPEKKETTQLALFDEVDAQSGMNARHLHFTSPGRLPHDVPSRREDSSPNSGGSLTLWTGLSFDASLGMSQRSGNLSWSIASDISGKRAPNVLSELSYDGLQIRGFEVLSTLHFIGSMLDASFLEARVHRGVITDGETRDSDYNGNNKTQEYSRSLSENTGDFVADYSLAYGYSWLDGEILSADILAGYSLHQQYVRKQNAIKISPESGEIDGAVIDGLNSTYQSQWQGPWFGATLSLQGEKHRFKLQGEVHSAIYYAQADWNLRDSFMHPKSFEHNATGLGWVLDASYAYTFSFSQTNKTTLGFSYRAEQWAAKDGVDTLYLANGEVVSTKLNEVAWGGSAVSIHLKVLR